MKREKSWRREDGFLLRPGKQEDAEAYYSQNYCPLDGEAARLTGCKNFSRARRLDAHTAEALDWGVALRTSREIPEDTLWVGYRAHDFVPVWGEGGDNLLKFDLESSAELPFEHNYYIKAGETVCWFVQREKMSEIEEKGLPDYLRLAEDKILFLK